MKKVLIFARMGCKIVAAVQTLPKEGEDFTPESTDFEPAGSAFQAYEMFDAFSIPVDLVAPVGSGVYGQKVEELAEEKHIPVEYHQDELQGVEYCFKDAQGKKTGMVVPGSEYDFDESFTEYTDGEEISAIVAFGDLFCGNGAEELVESISRFDCPFYFVPQGNIENIEEDVLKDILSLSCEVCLSGQEAGALHSSKDLYTAIGLLQKQTGRGVFCFTQDTGVVYRDGTEDLCVEWNTQIAVKEEDISVIILAFIISRISTVDVRNSLMFSKEYLERYLRNQKNMDAYDQDAQRQKLIHLITMK